MVDDSRKKIEALMFLHERPDSQERFWWAHKDSNLGQSGYEPDGIAKTLDIRYMKDSGFYGSNPYSLTETIKTGFPWVATGYPG